jgi:hypothetical protein
VTVTDVTQAVSDRVARCHESVPLTELGLTVRSLRLPVAAAGSRPGRGRGAGARYCDPLLVTVGCQGNKRTDKVHGKLAA